MFLYLGPLWTSLGGLLRPGLLSTDPDGQLHNVEPVHDEEPPACADEFDDFVTYEASAFLTASPLAPCVLLSSRAASVLCPVCVGGRLWETLAVAETTDDSHWPGWAQDPHVQKSSLGPVV